MSEWKSMEYLAVPSSSKVVGIALAAAVGAESITTAVAKALAHKGIVNVVVSLVEDPSILPFLAKSMTGSCDCVLAIAILSADSTIASANLTQQLVETGMVTGTPVVPGIISPTSLLELKALLPSCTTSWSNSVSSILAISGGAVPVPIGEIISEGVLAEAGATRESISTSTTDLDALLYAFRESMKVNIISHSSPIVLQWG